MKKRIRELENKRMDFEIKGKRVRTAAFSYSLILLFSLCCAGEADAAKLCAKQSNPGRLASVFGGCARTTVGQCTMGYIVGGEGCDEATQWCQNTQYVFIATLSSSTTDALAAPDLTNPMNNKAIWCKLVWPYTGNWTYIYTNPTSASGLYDCMNLLGPTGTLEVNRAAVYTASSK